MVSGGLWVGWVGMYTAYATLQDPLHHPREGNVGPSGPGGGAAFLCLEGESLEGEDLEPRANRVQARRLPSARDVPEGKAGFKTGCLCPHMSLTNLWVDCPPPHALVESLYLGFDTQA